MDVIADTVLEPHSVLGDIAMASGPETWIVTPGEPLPLGAHPSSRGVNFAVFSRAAEHLDLLLYDDPFAPEPTLRVELDARHHRTGDIWHAAVSGDLIGRAYGFVVNGATTPAEVLLDPYAAAAFELTQPPHHYRGLIVDQGFDWEGDEPPLHPWSDTVIYEAHVRGLTVHPTSHVRHPGTYLGIIDKIPYFKELGVTTLELMPAQFFDRHVPVPGPGGQVLTQYWGYDPIGLFAPMAAYASSPGLGAELRDFKLMVRELHRAGIEVILDIVVNHTAEGNKEGPTINLRALGDEIYYMKDEAGNYMNYTGCGNTMNCNHPIVREMIIGCLRHWVTHMHVDGFRFDLAAVLGRDSSGRLMTSAPLLDAIAEDPLLRQLKLIAEAWDMSSPEDIELFSAAPWAEWNGNYRDEVRRFWRGDPGMTGAFATRLCGSSDMFRHGGRGVPTKSINYVTCHDGFTLNDLVSYSHKHNEANGEGNRDGAWENYSDNHGVEGEADEYVEAARLRQIKNFLLTLFVSRGVPMVLGGDEFRRTQRGNNNAYCQDNEISWHDWGLVRRNRSLVGFVQALTAFRRTHPVLRSERFYDADDIVWLGVNGGSPDWDGPDNRLGCVIPQNGTSVCLLFNASATPVAFDLPWGPTRLWRVAFDTSNAEPDDVPPARDAPRFAAGARIHLPSRTSVVLTSA